MSFDDYVKNFYKNRKKKPNYDNLRSEFIDKGYEKFLWLNQREEDSSARNTKRKIRTLKKFDKPEILTSIVKEISEIISNDEFIFFFSYAPTKSYYLAKELAKRAHRTVVLSNVYEDDSSINTVAIFKREQVIEANLFFHSL
ncbi:hypothetical protein [Shouchella patagoniensis]|uniref:hypothetical protein n=1 Tax=Shouchella patagoniensis TaxID=228576 RepID=UPI000995B186|nr:hypothetical protein [Shouchella patagoniensis]